MIQSSREIAIEAAAIPYTQAIAQGHDGIQFIYNIDSSETAQVSYERDSVMSRHPVMNDEHYASVVKALAAIYACYAEENTASNPMFRPDMKLTATLSLPGTDEPVYFLHLPIKGGWISTLSRNRVIASDDRSTIAECVVMLGEYVDALTLNSNLPNLSTEARESLITRARQVRERQERLRKLADRLGSGEAI